MKLFILKRIAETTDGTFGVLLDYDTPFALTLERRWLNNEKSVSCIPAGTYKCRRVKSPKFGNTFEVTGVKDRSAILFHKGNLQYDSHGCILVGEMFGVLSGHNGIQASDAGFCEFLSRTKKEDEFVLKVVNA
jgi:hypothetical protein